MGERCSVRRAHSPPRRNPGNKGVSDKTLGSEKRAASPAAMSR